MVLWAIFSSDNFSTKSKIFVYSYSTFIPQVLVLTYTWTHDEIINLWTSTREISIIFTPAGVLIALILDSTYLQRNQVRYDKFCTFCNYTLCCSTKSQVSKRKLLVINWRWWWFTWLPELSQRFKTYILLLFPISCFIICLVSLT